MADTRKNRVRSKEAILGASLSSLLGVIALFQSGNLFSDASYDWLFPLRPTVVPDEAVIIYMDDESHRELKQPWFQAWDRSRHARLIDQLRTFGASAVVFDVLFDSPNTNNPAGDDALIRAAISHGRVFVAGKSDPIVINGEIIGWKPTPPFDELRKVTTWGLVEAGGLDGSVRKHYRSSDRIQTLAWEVARAVSTNALPDSGKDRWMNYYGPPGSIRWISYHEVLGTNSSLSSLVSNKVVFVGALFSVGFTGGKGTDDFRTPYSYWTGRKSPGVEINATAYLNLVRRDWLQRFSPGVEFSLVLIAGMALGFGLSLARPLIAGGIGAAVAILSYLAAVYLAAEFHSWFAWLAIAGVEVPVGVACSLAISARKLRQERNRLETAMEKARTAPRVQFSVSSRSAVSPGSSFVIDVWAHLESQRDEVRRRSAEPSSDAEISPFAAGDGVRLCVRLSIFGFNVLNQEETIHWCGTVTKATFLIAVPKDIEHGLQTGLASVYVQGLKVATVHFPLNVAPYEISSPSLTQEVKRPRKAFACYASPDRAEVLARVQGMQKARGDLDVFLDVHSLRSGQDWENEVRRAIMECDTFYLFWSESARKSVEVEREWRFALREKGRDFIDPVPLVSPVLVKPPEELASKHFNDWTLIYASSTDRNRPVS